MKQTDNSDHESSKDQKKVIEPVVYDLEDHDLIDDIIEGDFFDDDDSSEAELEELQGKVGQSKGLPDPKEIQSEIENLIKNKFGDNVKIVAKPVSMTDEMFNNLSTQNKSEEAPKSKNKSETKEDFKPINLNFNYKPKEIKDYLDKYVIKQDSAKKALAIAVCDHYNRIRRFHETLNASKESNKDSGEGGEVEDNYTKQNVLVLGPTGVGKTYLVRTIAKLIGVPFVKADATRFTETGYVGANVDDMVKDLVSIADDNIDLAQYGIIYFDEADKLAGNSNSSGKDISGRGVQYSLLKLMEETDIDLRSSHDVMSQLHAFMDFQKNGKVSKKVINTKHILFIVSGAFTGMEDIIKRRLKTKTIGLQSSQSFKKIEEYEKNIFEYCSTKDLIDFGFEPEFVGRLPVRLSCQVLSTDDLYQILKHSKGSIINQYIDSFTSYGINLTFDDDALLQIAKKAYEEKTGARGLMTICEKIFRDFKFELPSTDIKELNVTVSLVNNPQKVLKEILKSRTI